jgi:hypothetical protein
MMSADFLKSRMRMRNLIVLLLGVLCCATLNAHALEDFRGLNEAAEAPQPRRWVSDRSFGFGTHIELRPVARPDGFLWGIGQDASFRLYERFWLSAGATFLAGAAEGLNYGPRRRISHKQFTVLGIELRPLLRFDFAWWKRGGFYGVIGPSAGYFYGTGGGNRAQPTISAGPAMFIGFEAGRRVRAAWEGGAIVYYALNRDNAGWYASLPGSSKTGTHITLLRFSLRWYG